VDGGRLGRADGLQPRQRQGGSRRTETFVEGRRLRSARPAIDRSACAVAEFRRAAPQLMRKNCCHFCDELMQALAMPQLPHWITGLVSAVSNLVSFETGFVLRYTAVRMVPTSMASPTPLAATTPRVVISLFPPIFGIVLLAALVSAPPLAAPAARRFVVAARHFVHHAGRLLARTPTPLRQSGIPAPDLAMLSFAAACHFVRWERR
jgi:hypothetical protein